MSESLADEHRLIDSRHRPTFDAVLALVRARDDAWAVPPEGGAFLHALALARSARNAVELGTSYGYSTLWIAAALQQTGGRLTTFDREPRKAEAARDHLRQAGLSDRVDCRVGVIAEMLASIRGPIDFVFIDADKPASLGYLQQLRPHLADGAVVVTDNLIRPQHDWTEFLAAVRGDPGLFSMLVPVGNGMELTILRGSAARSGT